MPLATGFFLRFLSRFFCFDFVLSFAARLLLLRALFGRLFALG
jgi:hypothetical protein